MKNSEVKKQKRDLVKQNIIVVGVTLISYPFVSAILLGLSTLIAFFVLVVSMKVDTFLVSLVEGVIDSIMQSFIEYFFR